MVRLPVAVPGLWLLSKVARSTTSLHPLVYRSRFGCGVAFAQPAHRAISTLHAPKKLNDIVKLDLLTNESPGRILHIWMEYHAKKESSAAAILTRAEFDVVMFRSRKSPMFILPVKRDQGHFVMVGQFKERTIFLTHLEDYKKNPQFAEPYLAVTVHDELLKTKDIALVRGDFQSDKLKQAEAVAMLKDMFRLYYDTEEYKHVETLNARPTEFDWEAYMSRHTSKSND